MYIHVFSKHVLQKKTVVPDKRQKRCPVKQGTTRHYNTHFNNLGIMWSLITKRASTPRRTGRQTINRKVPDFDRTTAV
jgi:hypothetical protein